MPSTVRRLARRYLPASSPRLGLDPGRASSGAATTQAAAGQTEEAGEARKPEAAAPGCPGQSGQRPAIEVLRRGGSLPDAVVAEVRGLLGSARAGPGQRRWPTACGRIRVHRRSGRPVVRHRAASTGGYYALAWSHLRDLPESLWVRHAGGGMGLIPASTRSRTTPASNSRRLADDAPDHVRRQPGWPCSVRSSAMGTRSGRAPVRPARRARRQRSRTSTSPWWSTVTGCGPGSTASPDGAARPRWTDGLVSFAIMDYGHPRRARASANIGDHVQSLASLGHLARHRAWPTTGRRTSSTC